MTDYGPAAPHGPDMTGTHPPLQDRPLQDMSLNERQIFDYLLRPDDSYNSEGVYWADMSYGKRFAFVSSYDAKEAAKELNSIGRMIKADPLSPVAYYFKNMVLPGAGLGLEG